MTRIRKLARSLAVSEADLLLWLLEHAPDLGEVHPAQFLPPEIEDRARKALARGVERTLPERARAMRRLLVVGGCPSTATELRGLLSKVMEVRIVDGSSYREATQAAAELAWADVVAIWASTILPHRMALLYTRPRGSREKLVTVTRRGAAALCNAVAQKVRGMAAKQPPERPFE